MEEERVISLWQQEETEDFRSGKIIAGTISNGSGRQTIYKKQRRARIILYTGLAAILGLLSYLALFPQTPAPASEPTEVTKSDDDQKIPSLTGAEYFALGFANQYLSGDIQSAQNYTADGFQIPEEAVKVDKGVKVSSVMPSYVVSISKDKYRVVVKAFMKKQKQNYSVYLSVPLIVKDGGKFGVYDIPSYIPHPDTPKAPSNSNPEKESIPDVPPEARNVVDSFFRMLTEGKEYDLGSLFMDGKSRSNIPGEFVGLKELKAYEKDGDELNVKATAQIKVGGITQLQKYDMTLVKNDGRWKIIKTDPALPVK